MQNSCVLTSFIRDCSAEGFLKLGQLGLKTFILVSRELIDLLETYSNIRLIVLLCIIV